MRHLLTGLLLTLGLAFSAHAEEAADNGIQRFDISQTVVKMPLEEGVSVDDAMDFMRSKAAELNMKIVAHQPVSEELKARGVDSGPLHIMQFCNPGDAHRMVMHNAIFAAYMPCRIALVEDSEGKTWLMMLDLNLLIDNTPLPPDMEEMARGINDKLLRIMEAGAKGAF
ncbi:hypothetical protein TspCOW1_16470 [Thiohalobacter sp. COW1]|uniref:DUF302 domain-containing protein n=1 Tax=Thiohalobacter thiocyanaticus TaxID=585455 RepID=A0A1Z4VQB2_9GAMM|nr:MULTISPECIES: DUF302 domain-containing protein [Thiohalobacter]BAZ93414.1 uncharacterized protein FOKN1_1014 [Thiohalobacter thiocyanaticus]BCO31544.1 hypothetical protein TspCOW1_16470 [Thiohalobacter sp. COW1]